MKLFVYGTLKKGGYNHHLLKDAKFLGEATIFGKLYSMGSFPAMKEDGEQTSAVHGEVYEVDGFTKLDRLEGHPHLYKRTEFYPPEHWIVEPITGMFCTYVFQGSVEGRELIESGEWDVNI